MEHDILTCEHKWVHIVDYKDLFNDMVFVKCDKCNAFRGYDINDKTLRNKAS